jgi:hypothetical protein
VGKKRIIKKYEHLDAEILQMIKQRYPDGFEESLISFQTPSGELSLALPFETEEFSYLIKMPNNSLPEDDDDYDNGGNTSDSEFANFESLDIAENVAEDDEDE